jgi:adenylylsulfate kinase
MKRPIFVVGCPRSGTTLLYSMLTAAGGFAVYRKETHFYNLAPRFPRLTNPLQRQRFTDEFLSGYLGKVPGLDVEPFVRRALEQCRSTHEFLPLLMNAITSAQEMDRWIEGTPAHVSEMHQIRQAVPDALFVHVIRDGRDCALSNSSQRWMSGVLSKHVGRLGVSALFWEWMVRTGRAFGRANPSVYLEVRFEDLIADPSATMSHVGRFIDHDLDCERIMQNPVHAMNVPNTSFRDERERGEFNPVGRWKDRCAPPDVEQCERLVGDCLTELGYTLAYPAQFAARRSRARAVRASYLQYFSTRHWLKSKTILGRFMTNTSVWREQPRAGERPLLPRAIPHRAPKPRPADLEPAVVWLTGLSGAGKSTIGGEVVSRLRAIGAPVEYLDGDAIRSEFPNTGFSKSDRDAHVRRVGFLASRLEKHGIFVVCALISPYAESRAHVRKMCRRFKEIHVATPLAECERRDVKGLYERARRGEILQFTGVDDAYEPPMTPELRIDTSGLSVSEAADLVMAMLERADRVASPLRLLAAQ